jgi:DNA-binding LacI/PurR family transcriptional regulator
VSPCDPPAGDPTRTARWAISTEVSITYLAGPSNAWTDGERCRALAAHAGAAGLGFTRVGPFSPTLDQGGAAADIGLAGRATALVAFNDLLAIGVLRRLQHLGVAVPATLTGLPKIMSTRSVGSGA